MDRLVDIITNYYVRKNVITEDKRDIYFYGFKLIISDIINYAIIIILGIVLNRLIESVAFLISLCVLRQFSGGFHAKTFWLCRLSMIITYICVMALSDIIAYKEYSIITVSIINVISIVFIAVFAPTQVPIAIAEGILTVIVYNVIQKNCVKELKELSGITVSNPNRGKLWARNLVLALGVVLLVTIPLMLLGNSEFGGSDDAGSVMVEEIHGEYEAWFTPVLETALDRELPGEIESLIFCIQTGIGVGIIAFIMGRFVERKKWTDSLGDNAFEVLREKQKS